jgi:hypothetical protein
MVFLFITVYNINNDLIKKLKVGFNQKFTNFILIFKKIKKGSILKVEKCGKKAEHIKFNKNKYLFKFSRN